MFLFNWFQNQVFLPAVVVLRYFTFAELDPQNVARNNWKKLFAVRKFMSLAKTQTRAAPAQLLVGNRFVVGKKIANGAFGQLR